MAKVVVEIELDNVSYDRKYGPGSEHWEKYHYSTDTDTGVKTPLPASEYKSLEGQALHDTIIDTFHEGFYDWDSQGWMKLKIDGKAVRQCCQTVDGDRHKDYCPTVAGPEAWEVDEDARPGNTLGDSDQW